MKYSLSIKDINFNASYTLNLFLKQINFDLLSQKKRCISVFPEIIISNLWIKVSHHFIYNDLNL